MTWSGCSTRDDLVAGEDVFFSATGITDGDVLQGVRYPSAGGATTESLVTRTRSGTIRRIRATHDRAKLRAVAAATVLRLLATAAGLLVSGLIGVLEREAPARDSARSRRASERRKPWVTITWIRDWVAS